VIPHITNEIKERIRAVSRGQRVDVVITEIGGTVGDIESLPFLEAIRQFRLDVGRENVIYIHLTLIPFIKAAGEMKTKPTQHSVGTLREIGIQPDILVCRSERPVAKSMKQKISLFCNVEEDAVIAARDVRSIYEVPLALKEEGLDRVICRYLKIPYKAGSLENWKRNVVDVVLQPKNSVKVAVVGKYIELQDAYKSIYEALRHGSIANHSEIHIKRVNAETVSKRKFAEVFRDVDGILVPGGFGDRGIQGKIDAIQYARENKIPFLGICLGMQCAVIEFARNVAGLKGADSTEFNKKTTYPVISLLEEQKKVKDLGGTMRLGRYRCNLQSGSLIRSAYGVERVFERHRHRYEFNNHYKDTLSKSGLRVAGIYANGTEKLVEVVELEDHPWFVASQFHPEFKSKPNSAHPLFRDFIKASLMHQKVEKTKVNKNKNKNKKKKKKVSKR